jgi:hypothetical protein
MRALTIPTTAGAVSRKKDARLEFVSYVTEKRITQTLE